MSANVEAISQLQPIGVRLMCEVTPDLREGLKHEAIARAFYDAYGPSDIYPWRQAGRGVRDFWRAKVGFVINAHKAEKTYS